MCPKPFSVAAPSLNIEVLINVNFAVSFPCVLSLEVGKLCFVIGSEAFYGKNEDVFDITVS